jgi:hypothetical protein
MIRLSCDHFTAAATLTADGLLTYPMAPILKGWRGKHYRAVIAYYTSNRQFIEAQFL